MLLFAGEELPIDASGCYIYADRCKKAGIIPVSYLIRNMGEGNFRMRHHYLGPEGTKPLAHALKVILLQYRGRKTSLTEMSQCHNDNQ